MRYTLAVLSLLPVVFAARTLPEVEEAFEDANIPSNIALEFDPSFLLQVILPQVNNTPISLEAGDQIPRNSTALAPTLALVGENIGQGPFVVATVDPDAPSPQTPIRAQVRHFLGGNFFTGSLCEDVSLLVNATNALSSWRQPTPPAGSDAHRYIFLVFNQPEGFNDQTLVNGTTPTAQFNISAFGEAVGLGNPIAGNFMLVAPDPV